MSLLDEIIATCSVDPPPPKVGFRGCCRDRCKLAAVDGHDFCSPCLAWLRYEVDDDPLAPSGPTSPPHPCPVPSSDVPSLPSDAAAAARWVLRWHGWV